MPCIWAELKQDDPYGSSAFPSVPMVLISRFKDNVYLVCMNIPDALIPTVRGLTHLLFLMCTHCERNF